MNNGRPAPQMMTIQDPAGLVLDQQLPAPELPGSMAQKKAEI